MALENLVERFAACGLSWEVQEPKKWSLFGSLLESKKPPQIWGVKIIKEREVILELECTTDPRVEGVLKVAMSEHRNPIFKGCTATKVAVSRYITIGTQSLSREQRARIFEALNMHETEEVQAAEVIVNLPIPGWVGAMGDWPHAHQTTEERALVQIEEFLRALPKELLPSWAQPPGE